MTAILAVAMLSTTFAGCHREMSADPMPRIQEALALRAGGGEGGAATTVAAAPTGTGWGTLKGVFRYGGSPPQAGSLSTGGKDAAVCGQEIPIQTLIVDPSNKGIANIVIYARKVSRVSDEAKQEAAKKVEFDQKHCLFLSHVLAVETKHTVVVKNSDPIGHNTSITPPGQQGINPLLPAGGEAEYKFAKAVAMPVDVTCSIHPWMKAYIMARDDPYFAVTAADGSFEIKNLPAGEDIEFQVWQERPGVNLDIPGLATKGRFKRKIPADGVEDLKEIVVPPEALK
jgi:hypothetical protein